MSKYVKHMTTQLEKLFFNKKTTCSLAGLLEHQFDYFIKRALMIENKARYSMNDIIYISICNSFKSLGFDWYEIKNFLINEFNSLNEFRKNNFLNYDTFSISIDINENDLKFSFVEKNDIVFKKSKKHPDLKDIFVIETYHEAKDVSYVNNALHILFENNTNVYLIFIYKIIDKIILKSKELDLKIDVEHILLSA